MCFGVHVGESLCAVFVPACDGTCEHIWMLVMSKLFVIVLCMLPPCRHMFNQKHCSHYFNVLVAFGTMIVWSWSFVRSGFVAPCHVDSMQFSDHVFRGYFGNLLNGSQFLNRFIMLVWLCLSKRMLACVCSILRALYFGDFYIFRVSSIFSNCGRLHFSVFWTINLNFPFPKLKIDIISGE